MDENELFKEHMRYLGLLTDKKPTPLRKELQEEAPSQTEKELDQDRALFMSALSHMKTPEKETLMDTKPIRLKLAKNRVVRVQDQIDLHGEKAQPALEHLDLFVRTHYRSGTSCLLVITGKGKNSPGQSVLKPLVKSWILGKGARFIQSWASAPRIQGGDGAFVLYLRKRIRKQP